MFGNHLNVLEITTKPVLMKQKTMQKVLSRLDELISWSRMRFKAKKSRSLTFCKGRQKQVKFKIAGEYMPTVKEKPVKSLGRWYADTLSDKSRGMEVTKQAKDGPQKIDESKLPGKYNTIENLLATMAECSRLASAQRSPLRRNS